MMSRITSLAYTPFASAPSTRTWRSLGLAMARHWVASTSRTWLVPMPNAMAPTAPCVDVWLSPHAMVMPGWVSPSSGPMTCTIPCLPLSSPNSGTRRVGGVLDQVDGHLLGHLVGERALLRRRRDDVVERGERAPGHAHGQVELAQRREGLRRRDLVDQVEPDQELRLTGGQCAHRVRLPDLVEQGVSHVHSSSGANRTLLPLPSRERAGVRVASRPLTLPSPPWGEGPSKRRAL